MGVSVFFEVLLVIFLQFEVSLFGVVRCKHVNSKVVDSAVEFCSFEVQLSGNCDVDPHSHQLAAGVHLVNELRGDLVYLHVTARALLEGFFWVRNRLIVVEVMDIEGLDGNAACFWCH